jgi:LacI family transcriptional regulator, galactose operon repressor
MNAGRPHRIGIAEVAKHAGVAVSSVSRVVSGHPDVSERMRKRVLAAIEELGFVPDVTAQSLRTGSTKTVGFVVSDIRNPLIAEIAHTAETRLRERGYALLLMSSLHDPGLEAEHLRMLTQRRVDGLLISVTDERNPATVELLGKVQVPVVLVDRDVPELTDAWTARFDHAAGLAEAVDHLVGLGHEHIGLVSGSANVRPSREREQALHRVVASYPGVRASSVVGDFTSEHGAKATQALMTGDDRPTALISGSNQILVGVLSALAGLPVEVPRDVSLVTCDDVPMAAFVRPRLATIRRDVSLMGRTAADLLLEALAGEPRRSAELSTRFEQAESCAPANVSKGEA